jgi:hypothetical protein
LAKNQGEQLEIRQQTNTKSNIKKFEHIRLSNERTPLILFFGYSNNLLHFGGGIWLKKVVDCIEGSQQILIKKVASQSVEKNLLFPFFKTDALLKGYLCKPNIAVLDAYGDLSLSMWVILRVFKPSTKIVTIFHHFEPRITRCRHPNILYTVYSRCLDFLIKKMLQNSNAILTVSESSSVELRRLLNYQNNDKIIGPVVLLKRTCLRQQAR